MPLQLEIVTPEGRVLEKPADSVVLPTALGEIGVLPGHIPLTALLEAGELRLTSAAQVDAYVIGNGFAMIENDRVSVLTDSAIDTDNIDEAVVEEACRRAERALAEKTTDLDPAEIERLESVVRFAVAQLSVKKKR
jgi:F-type H+-transporting ATPase subunit epsilon